MKACARCGEVGPPTDFYRSSHNRDGRHAWCKPCCATHARDRHRERMEGDPGYREARRERGRERYRQNRDRWPVADPQQKNARGAVADAIRDGRITPPDHCEDCGHDFSEFRREGHHEDYDKPLDVAWLCSLCHGKRHRGAA